MKAHSTVIPTRRLALISLIENNIIDLVPFQEMKWKYTNYMGEEAFNRLYRIALDRFSVNFSNKKEFYINQSLHRYEAEVKRLMEKKFRLNDRGGLEAYCWNYALVLELLKEQETLVGLRSPAVKIKVSNIIKERKNKIEEISDFSMLSIEQKSRLLTLLDKSRVSDFEQLQSIKLTKDKLTIDEVVEKGEDVQFEYIKEIKPKKRNEVEPIDVLGDRLEKVQKTHLNS